MKLGNNAKIMVKGKRNLKLQIGKNVQVITSVFYVPNLENNLLSLGQLQEMNLDIHLQNNECRVYHFKRRLIIRSVMSSNRMFAIKATVIVLVCFKATNEESTLLWHKRYAHLSFKGLNLLAQKGMVKGFPRLDKSSKVCAECMVGKQHRESLSKKSAWRTTKRLELIHVDICGPIKPESNSKKRYFITFIDNFSRKIWVYFLTKKYAALETFNKFKVFGFGIVSSVLSVRVT